MKPYGKELILDLHNCDVVTFTRASIKEFFAKLCDLIDMEREDLHFWDYEGDPEGYEKAEDHLKGITAVQFIRTSNIIIHTVDTMKNLHVNVFSCKDFECDVVQEFTENWFHGESLSVTLVPRSKQPKVEILQQKNHNFLWINDYLMMWDILPERNAQRFLAKQSHGDVLVAGYGLGLVQKYLMDRDEVRSVTTVELLPEVVQANEISYGLIYGKVVIGDFYKFVGGIYDCVIGDIWADILPDFLPDYKKFKDKAGKLLKPDGKILAWGGDYFEYLIEKETQ